MMIELNSNLTLIANNQVFRAVSGGLFCSYLHSFSSPSLSNEEITGLWAGLMKDILSPDTDEPVIKKLFLESAFREGESVFQSLINDLSKMVGNGSDQGIPELIASMMIFAAKSDDLKQAVIENREKINKVVSEYQVLYQKGQTAIIQQIEKKCKTKRETGEVAKEVFSSLQNNVMQASEVPHDHASFLQRFLAAVSRFFQGFLEMFFQKNKSNDGNRAVQNDFATKNSRSLSSTDDGVAKPLNRDSTANPTGTLKLSQDGR